MANPYSLYSQAELVEMLSALKAELIAVANGKRFVSGTVGGKTFTRQVRKAEEIEEQLGKISAALNQLDPDTYPLEGVTSRTVAAFGS
jgi:hypothetical protein